jgi:hypothetical protein
MTCKQCRDKAKCEEDAFIHGATFDPYISAKYCTGFEPITNADRIRAMSDEELAKFICEWCNCVPGYCPGVEMCTPSLGKANGLVKWLQQPAEEG